MRSFSVSVTGKTPLLMHPDDVDWADTMENWKNDPANKSKGKAGDDRTPPWRWVGNLYHDGTHIVMPPENIMKALSQGAAMVPTGRGQKTFKEQSQSGIVIPEAWQVLVGSGKSLVGVSRIHASITEDIDFAGHRRMAAEHGFDLHVRRAKIGAAKHVRVRPIFREWSLQGTLVVIDEAITDKVLADIFNYAGTYKGLGDWRPGCTTPGQFGTFSAEIKRI